MNFYKEVLDYASELTVNLSDVYINGDGELDYRNLDSTKDVVWC